MTSFPANQQRRSYGWWATIPMLVLLIVPIAALIGATTPTDIVAHIQTDVFAQAFWLSLRTSLISLALVMILGLPLSWYLAHAPRRYARFIEPIIDLPIVLPPAVLGVALLVTFSEDGLFGSFFSSVGIHLPFSSAAVILAQMIVSAPFFIQSSNAAFKSVDPDLLLVSRTLGRSSWDTFWLVTMPLALPGIMSGAALAWARSLGEFGATLIFAGNFPGTTQTIPLAIYVALESDVKIALTLSVILASIALVLLFCLRLVPVIWQRHRVPMTGVLQSHQSRRDP